MEVLHSFFAPLAALMRKIPGSLVELGPKLLGVVVILVVGYVIGRVLRWIAQRTTARLGVDQIVKNSRLAESEGSGFPVVPSVLFGKLAFWLIMFTAVLAGFDVLGIRTVSGSFSRLLLYLPNVFAAIVILVAGIFLAQAARTAVMIGVEKLGLEFSRQIPAIAYYAVLVVALLMAAEQLKINISALENLLYLLLGAVCLFLVLLIAWGARHTAENIIAGYYLRRMLQVGTHVSSENAEGIVELIDNTHVRLRTGGKQTLHVPNARLFREICRVDDKAKEE